MESNYSDGVWCMKHSADPNMGSSNMGVFLKMPTDGNKIMVGGGSDLGGGVWCKKHPKHYQSPGVCSCCLREKLSVHINTSSSSSSFSSSFYSSSSSPPSENSCPITMIQPADHTYGRVDDSGSNVGVGDELGLDIDGKDGLKRSHSSCGNENRKKKVGGFLLKFLKPTSKKCSRVLMMHSKTMTEPRSKRFY